ncbi:T9SS type A sorting domain-containing protein [Chryseobacterium suipulveris]
MTRLEKITTQNLNNGNYIIKINVDGEIISKRIIINNKNY